MRIYQILSITGISMLLSLCWAVSASADVYGSPFDESIAISKVGSLSTEMSGQTITLEGSITSLCKGNGCWLNLKDDTGEVMVDLKPYDFRIPKDSLGRDAQVQGKVKVNNLGPSVDAISIKILE